MCVQRDASLPTLCRWLFICRLLLLHMLRADKRHRNNGFHPSPYIATIHSFPYNLSLFTTTALRLRSPAMKAVLNGTVLAESDNTVVVEGNHYFPPDSVNKQALSSSVTQ